MDTPLARRRRLRAEATEAEGRLWRLLRSRQLLGFKFRRQHPFDPYVLDFFCPRAHLAVELDGGQHFDPTARAYDERRSQLLAQSGVQVIRFTNPQVLDEPLAVLELILRTLNLRTTTSTKTAPSTPSRPSPKPAPSNQSDSPLPLRGRGRRPSSAGG